VRAASPNRGCSASAPYGSVDAYLEDASRDALRSPLALPCLDHHEEDLGEVVEPVFRESEDSM
jgi:hypothetical protein